VKLGADARLLLLLGAIIAALFLKALPLALPELTVEPEAGKFNTVRAAGRLERILGDERPHAVDTTANDAVRARLLAEIEALGFKPEVRDDFTCRTMTLRSRVTCARVQNVVFRAGPPGTDAVMIASHYDSVPAGPGAGDDGIGVAVSLEIAKLLAEDPPKRPVVFLITDGEEQGLIGAHSFATADPLSDEIDAVINIEARGVRGPAQMFQTSDPNAVDVAAFVRGAARPFANSLMTDIYRLLPNDTDVTEFLPKGYDAINLALTEGVEFYHTPRDTIANLDLKSVQHMGENALGSFRGFIDASDDDVEAKVIFTDLFSRIMVALPQWLGGGVILAALVIASVSFFRDKGARPVRAFLTAPATIILAAGLAYGAQALIGAIRDEAQYWLAYPQAMQGVAYFSAALAAALALKWIAAGVGATRTLHASWFWIAALGAASWLVAPGASILFAIPLIAYIGGAGFALVAPVALRPLALLAAILLVILLLPTLHLAEIGLGFATAAIFAVVAALIVVSALPLILGEDRISLFPPAATGVALAAAFGAAAVAPAYSEETPQPLNIIHFVDADAETAYWALGMTEGERAPKEFARLHKFATTEIEGLGSRVAAPAEFVDTPAPELLVLSATADGEKRTLHIAIAANGADAVYARIPEEAKAVAVREAGAGARTLFGEFGAQTLYCAGRACDGARLEIELDAAAPADWLVFGMIYGLPYDAWPLVNARPETATPIQNGDVTIVMTKRTM
jgi:hypothetical protein